MPNKVQLTPLERETRNHVIRCLSSYGITNKSIANIMGTTESTVSRAIDSEQVNCHERMETILW